MIQVAVIDRQPLMRAGVVSWLDDADGIGVAAAADCVAEIVAAGCVPDVVVISANDLAAIDVAPVQQRWDRASLVLYLSSAALGAGEAILPDGAAALVTRETCASELVAAVRAAATGRTYLAAPIEAPQPDDTAAPDCTLTRREREVLRVVALGLTNHDIAERLRISEHTVKSHLHHVMRKLDADTRAAAVHQAMLRTLI